MRFRLHYALVAYLLAGCGDGTTGPITEVLNTDIRTELPTIWPQYEISIRNISWRFVAVDRNGVRGSFESTWLRESGPSMQAGLALRCVDSAHVTIDCYSVADEALTWSLEPGVPVVISGNFTLSDVTKIRSANSITAMEVWAFFQPPPVPFCEGPWSGL